MCERFTRSRVFFIVISLPFPSFPFFSLPSDSVEVKLHASILFLFLFLRTRLLIEQTDEDKIRVRSCWIIIRLIGSLFCPPTSAFQSDPSAASGQAAKTEQADRTCTLTNTKKIWTRSDSHIRADWFPFLPLEQGRDGQKSGVACSILYILQYVDYYYSYNCVSCSFISAECAALFIYKWPCTLVLVMEWWRGLVPMKYPEKQPTAQHIRSLP